MSKPILDRQPVSDLEMRTCRVCLISKQLNLEFSFHKTYECYSTYCKDCANKRRRLKLAGLPIPEEYNNLLKKEKVKFVIQNKPWRKTTRANRKRLQYKTTDKKKGLDCDLTVEFVEKALNSPCFYCKFPSVGLDRIDNSLGHTMSNSVSCCYECNLARNSNFTHEEMKIIGKAIRKIKISRKDNI